MTSAKIGQRVVIATSAKLAVSATPQPAWAAKSVIATSTATLNLVPAILKRVRVSAKITPKAIVASCAKKVITVIRETEECATTAACLAECSMVKAMVNKVLVVDTPSSVCGRAISVVRSRENVCGSSVQRQVTSEDRNNSILLRGK